jgi:hypothetical protein
MYLKREISGNYPRAKLATNTIDNIFFSTNFSKRTQSLKVRIFRANGQSGCKNQRHTVRVCIAYIITILCQIIE